MSILSSWLMSPIMISGKVLSILVISISTCVSFPAKSFMVILSVVFSVYSFVNIFLSLDNVHPSTSCISSFDVIVTFTFSLVGFFVLYSTLTFGAVLSK